MMKKLMSNEDIKIRCDVLLVSMLASNEELAERWWHSPNKHWDLRKPSVVFMDNPWEVYEYLLQHADSGGW
jgi:hypothetical protein